jgi:hypothetical protein
MDKICDIPQEGFWGSMRILASGLDHIANGQAVIIALLMFNLLLALGAIWIKGK